MQVLIGQYRAAGQHNRNEAGKTPQRLAVTQ